MRFMLIIKATGYSEAGVYHSQEHTDAMMAYKKSLARVGALLAAEELRPSSSGMRICYPLAGGEPEIQAGPFPVDQELVAEYTVIDVRSENEALKWALRMPVPAGRECTIEIRGLEENANSLSQSGMQTMEADLQDHLHMLRRL
ncbi:YciI family protein [Paenibacillus piri]|uniref:YciI family protein n=2 Tax=Paenibacillus piri TaxID=2547395 RepID=A0A4R5K8Q7_9BACL|nr:YciI family protein [Paenibacillus piri]